jgi:hypothetical protein
METQMDDVTVTVAPTAAEVLAFLNGAGPINGNWFGEPKPERTRGNFWWRKYLAALDLPAIKAAARREAFEENERLREALKTIAAITENGRMPLTHHVNEMARIALEDDA